MSGAELSSVAYKKGNLLRYSLWAAAAVCIAVLIINFFNIMSSSSAVTMVPEGYRFAITDDYSDGSKVRTTYYVYEDKIIVEDESFEAERANRILMLYDGISTTSLNYDASDTADICQLGACRKKPKVLSAIKKLLSQKTGREYIGF